MCFPAFALLALLVAASGHAEHGNGGQTPKSETAVPAQVKKTVPPLPAAASCNAKASDSMRAAEDNIEVRKIVEEINSLLGASSGLTEFKDYGKGSVIVHMSATSQKASWIKKGEKISLLREQVRDVPQMKEHCELSVARVKASLTHVRDVLKAEKLAWENLRVQQPNVAPRSKAYVNFKILGRSEGSFTETQSQAEARVAEEAAAAEATRAQAKAEAAARNKKNTEFNAAHNKDLLQSGESGFDELEKLNRDDGGKKK